MSDHPPSGLRELKKRRIREQIRERALALFVEHGYRETTMEQIAAAAEVAPRTVYRYFPTKDTLVITDEDDEQALERFRAALAEHPPVEALRIAFNGLLLADGDERNRVRTELLAAHPELQAAMLGNVVRLAEAYATAIVEHTGRREDAEAALTLTAAAAGIAIVMLDRPEGRTALEQSRRFDEAIARLAQGFASSPVSDAPPRKDPE